MEFKGRFNGLSNDWATGQYIISFTVEEMTEGSLFQGAETLKEKELDIKAVKHRKKRSRDANAYAWVLMQRLAEAAHTDKETIYLRCLRRYSRAFTHVIVKPQAVEAMRELYRTFEDLGDITIRDEETGKITTGRQLRVYYGSSTFDTKEMSVFIDGIISECKECGIETLPPRELEKMKAGWIG